MHIFLIKFILTLPLLLKNYVFFTCLMKIWHFYNWSRRTFFQLNLKENSVYTVFLPIISSSKVLRRFACYSPQIFGKIFKKSFLKRKNYAWRKGNPHVHACTNRLLNTSLINFLTFKIIIFYHAFKFDFYGGIFYRHWIVVIYLFFIYISKHFNPTYMSLIF